MEAGEEEGGGGRRRISNVVPYGRTCEARPPIPRVTSSYVYNVKMHCPCHEGIQQEYGGSRCM
jgi:hypothetical protein